MMSGIVSLEELEAALNRLRPSMRRFSAELEAAYEAATSPARFKRLVRFLLATLVMTTFCLVLDAHVGSHVLRLGLFLRLGVYLPITLASILYLRSGYAFNVFAGIATGAPMLAATALALVLARSSPEPFSERYLLGITVAIVAQVMLAPIPLRYAVPGLLVSIGVLCGLALAPLPRPFNPPVSSDLPIFLAAAAIALTYAMRNRDFDDRKDFLLVELNALRMAELLRINSRLERLSSTDALTGIFNRRHLDIALERLWELAHQRKRSLGILMVDIDHFKRVNDTDGHQQGDFCLEQVAQVIQQSIRAGMDTAGRYGGEEFLVILPEADEAETRAIGERVRNSVQALALPNITYAPVTVSIGAAVLDPAMLSTTKHELVALADQALYRAKRSGRNQLCCESEVGFLTLKRSRPESSGESA